MGQGALRSLAADEALRAGLAFRLLAAGRVLRPPATGRALRSMTAGEAFRSLMADEALRPLTVGGSWRQPEAGSALRSLAPRCALWLLEVGRAFRSLAKAEVLRPLPPAEALRPTGEDERCLAMGNPFMLGWRVQHSNKLQVPCSRCGRAPRRQGFVLRIRLPRGTPASYITPRHIVHNASASCTMCLGVMRSFSASCATRLCTRATRPRRTQHARTARSMPAPCATCSHPSQHARTPRNISEPCVTCLQSWRTLLYSIKLKCYSPNCRQWHFS